MEQSRDSGHRNYITLREDVPPFQSDVVATGINRLSFAKQWIRDLTPITRSKLVATKEQISQLLGVNSLTKIQKIKEEIKEDPKKAEEKSKEAYKMLGKMYDIQGDEKEVALKINSYGDTADGLIHSLTGPNEILSNYATRLEMITDIDSSDDPTDLLLKFFNDDYATEGRFEAKRKLVLMTIFASIDQGGKGIDNKSNFNKFVKFLSEHVTEGKIGQTEDVYVLSKHDPKTFACTSYEFLNAEEAEKIKLEKGQKLTEIRWRRFKNGSLVSTPIYTSPREKELYKKALKMLRTDQENPNFVDDDLGVQGILNSTKDMNKFLRRLIQGAKKFGSSMSVEDIDIKDGSQPPRVVGSDPNLRQMDFKVRVSGTRVEVMLHTINTFLDYKYRRGLSHDEYEVRRLFQTGVIELLFPKSIYGIDWNQEYPKIMQKIRERIES